MTKNRICATATGLPRRTFLAGAAATPAAFAVPALAMTDPQDEISAYARGFRDGQRKMVELVRKTVEANQPESAETAAAKVKRLAKEMSDGLDQMAFESGDTGWQLSMVRKDTTGDRSTVVLLIGYEGQASNRRKFSEVVWKLA